MRSANLLLHFAIFSFIVTRRSQIPTRRAAKRDSRFVQCLCFERQTFETCVMPRNVIVTRRAWRLCRRICALLRTGRCGMALGRTAPAAHAAARPSQACPGGNGGDGGKGGKRSVPPNALEMVSE